MKRKQQKKNKGNINPPYFYYSYFFGVINVQSVLFILTAVENSDTEEETLGALKGDSGMSSPVIAVLQDFLNEDSAECQQKNCAQNSEKIR